MLRSKTLFRVLALVVLLSSLLAAVPAYAQPPAPEDNVTPLPLVPEGKRPAPGISKYLDQPNAYEVARIMQRQAALANGDLAQAAALAKTGTDRVLVILVEFAGTDTFTWNPGDTWDPIGKADPNEAVLDDNGAVVVGDCSKIITETKTFTYSGPQHNQIPRPLSAEDRSGETIWTEDFSNQYYANLLFGDGVVLDYTRVDGSHVHQDFTGDSVRRFYEDQSLNQYHIVGDVIGWLQLPHSTWYYSADTCPGRRSGPGGVVPGAAFSGAIPGAGDSKQLVRDALDAVNAISNTIPGFDWKNYDLNGDGIIDRLWIVHSGYGEEDSTTLLNRTDYGDSSMWSHSSAITPAYPVSPDVAAGPYIMMPENSGIDVFAHESGHNIGAMDLYAYQGGETSAGFWTMMADDWVGYPIGFLPQSFDPMHLDMWGWLNPLVITDTSKTYEVKIAQTSQFPGGQDVYRGVKIQLPDGVVPLPVRPIGNWYWWGGNKGLSNGMMTLKQPIAIPAAAATKSAATLSFDAAYGIETGWDFLWVQASDDGGQTWKTLTNANTSCEHDPEWIGGLYGFPEDLCAAGIGGLTDYNADFPDYTPQTFDLSAFAGKSILLRLWYMTDWGTEYEGPFVDNIQVTAGGETLLSDNAESDSGLWTYAEPWVRSNGNQVFSHNFYLQWRNLSQTTGGYDRALGDPMWRFGPANPGLLIWYNNNLYNDNEVLNHLTDWPGFGPKGRMLVIDSHPAPYRDPALVAGGYNNEAGNITSRALMRDAPFSLLPAIPFTYRPPTVSEVTQFNGRLPVSSFHDAFGYYPGAEYVSRGPGYTPATANKWVTRQWDSSVVMPAQAYYGVRAPGYLGNEQFRFDCEVYPGGRLACYWFPSGLGYNGGSGNPGDFDAQYGWHVQILNQTESMATVKIWNSKHEMNVRATASRPTVPSGQNVRYTLNVNENQGSAMQLFACAPIDTTKVEYVPGSVTENGLPLSALCPDVPAGMTMEQLNLSALEARENQPVLAVAWYRGLATKDTGRFSFEVKVKAATGTLQQQFRLFDMIINSNWRKTVDAPAVTVTPPF